MPISEDDLIEAIHVQASIELRGRTPREWAESKVRRAKVYLNGHGRQAGPKLDATFLATVDDILKRNLKGLTLPAGVNRFGHIRTSYEGLVEQRLRQLAQNYGVDPDAMLRAIDFDNPSN